MLVLPSSSPACNSIYMVSMSTAHILARVSHILARVSHILARVRFRSSEYCWGLLTEYWWDLPSTGETWVMVRPPEYWWALSNGETFWVLVRPSDLSTDETFWVLVRTSETGETFWPSKYLWDLLLRLSSYLHRPSHFFRQSYFIYIFYIFFPGMITGSSMHVPFLNWDL